MALAVQRLVQLLCMKLPRLFLLPPRNEDIAHLYFHGGLGPQ